MIGSQAMSHLKNQKVCVIGSNCFTGSHIVDSLLEQGCEVWGVSRSPEYDQVFLPYKRHQSDHFHFEQIDMVTEGERLLALLVRVQPETVIMVAAFSEVVLSHYRPLEYFHTNTESVIRLCSALRER